MSMTCVCGNCTFYALDICFYEDAKIYKDFEDNCEKFEKGEVMTHKQTESILQHLQTFGSITPIEALELFGCFRLASRIWDLRAAGHDIKTENVTSGEKTYAKYILVNKESEQFQFSLTGGDLK